MFNQKTKFPFPLGSQLKLNNKKKTGRQRENDYKEQNEIQEEGAVEGQREQLRGSEQDGWMEPVIQREANNGKGDE